MVTPAAAQNKRLRFGVFELDISSGELRKQGVKIRIEGQPLDVLAMLLERPGEVVTREEIQQKLWLADTFVDFERSINTAVKRLRQALNDSADTPRYIETLPRRGYRFIYPLHAGTEALPPTPVRSFRHKRAAVAGVAILAIVSAAVFAVRRWVMPPAPIRTIAVLPFENFTGDAALDYLGPAVGDLLTTEFAQVPGLQVPSFTSANHFADQLMPLREIARELNAGAVVEGSIHRSGERFSVNVQLIEARSDRNLWAKIYQPMSTDLSALPGQIARDVVAAMRIPLTPDDRERMAHTRSVHPEANGAYLQGVFHMQRATPDDRIKARDLFLQAVEKDANFAPAYGRLALLYSHGGGYLAGGPVQARQLAREWSAKALQLDSNLAEPHTARGWVLQTDWDWRGAEEEFQRAIALNPNLTVARTWYAQFLASLGRHEEAVHHAQRAIELDPASANVLTHAAMALEIAGRREEAAAYWHKVIETGPHYPPAYHFLSRWYIAKGMYGDALKAVEATRTANGYAVPDQALLAYAYAKTRRRQEATRLLRELEQRVAKQGQGHTSVAQVYVALGNHDHALMWLEKGYELRAGGMFTLLSNPLFEPLHADPRFIDLLRRIGFPPESIAGFVAAARAAQ